MTRVMAQGTFDLVHPGHIHYLERSRALGDELFVVIARDARIEPGPVMDEEARRIVVDTLKPVDSAVLGSEEDIFVSVERVEPDIITLGYDQPYDVAVLEEKLDAQGFTGIAVERIDAYEGSCASSTELRERVRER